MNDIIYSWQSTPQLWMAMRDNYCGCGECSRGNYGIGRTKEEALVDLLEKEERWPIADTSIVGTIPPEESDEDFARQIEDMS